MLDSFLEDFYAAYGEEWEFKKGLMRLIKSRELRYIFVGRYSIESKSMLFRIICRYFRHRMAVKMGTEISFQNVGRGITISHGVAITINAQALLGTYVSLRKGITIGIELRGARKGTPVIGNNVWIGPNATIVGKIVIGDDVLIAPNSYVNFDVPSHSIVIGNPARIIPSEWATESYILYFNTDDAGKSL